MLIIHAIATFESEADIEKLLPAAQAMVVASRGEPGCIDYAFARDFNDPKTVRIVERWTDQASLTAHFQAPHMAAFQKAMGAVKVSSLSAKLYDASGERNVLG